MVLWIPFTVLGSCTICCNPSADSWLNQDRICHSFWTLALLDCWSPCCWLGLCLGPSTLVLYKLWLPHPPVLLKKPLFVHPSSSPKIIIWGKWFRLSKRITAALTEFFSWLLLGVMTQVQLLWSSECLYTSYESGKSVFKENSALKLGNRIIKFVLLG